uniref:Zinc finger protein 106 homolog n=1 Tax=Nothobranchius korthausae TaxID=1143690 RepID=A0A1A8GLN8_9TELE
MAEVTPLKVKEHKAPDKKPPKGSKNRKSVYCPLCRKWHLKYKGHDHMHSLQHHQELESVLGRDACHDCQACKIKLSGLNEYIKHISTSQHTARLNSLKTKNIKPVSVFKTLGPEIMKSVMERNKMLRKSTKKAEKKEKKKAKQKAGKRKQGVAQEMTFAFKKRTEDRMRGMPAKYQNWQPQTSGQGGNCVVVRNKENKMFQAQRPVKDGEPPFHNPNWMPVHPPGMPSGWPFNSQFVQYSFSSPANPPSYPSHLGDHPQSRFHHYQPNRHFEGPHHHQVGSSGVQIPNAGNFSNAYDCSYNVSAGDPSQMDQLLAVSLREDELSCSLQDLDKSLIQARTALQAAYAEVQKLLLLKEQMTSEVNSLRTKRIEILQGMQVGYSKASSPAGTTSPSGGASILPPASVFSSSDFSTSTSQQPPAATPTSFITQSLPAPVAHPLVSVKQEVNPVLVQADAPFFPSNLLQQSPSAPSSSAARLAAESSASSTESSATRVKIQMEPQRSESESVEEVGGNPKKGTNKPAPEQQRTTSEKSDGGDESDSSVEMIDSSVLEVIDVDESDGERSVQPEEPSASVELTSVSTQTSLKSETDSKFQPPKDADVPPESAEADEPSLGAFSSHEGPVHGLQVHNGLLYTCSGDNTARAYSLMTRECEAVFHGHTNKVNCLLVSSPPNMPARLYTGSSDQTIRCYSLKTKKCLEKISLPDRVFCLHIAWNILYVGLANGSVISLDLKTLKELDVFECHGPRGVSCLGTAQEGARRLLLVGSYDSTISVRDARSSLLLRSLEGHTKTVLCMKVVNDLVFSGSSDTSVHAHNIHTGELVRIYKGHGHAVTSIVILGKVMVTACLDKLVRVYELQSHDRLQVYGGHSDMVMCMAVHKSVIYTGCYDGSVQAVKLNLMRNHRCWWQSCSLIFGVPEHLLHHLVTDHSNPNLQTVKCRWKDCNAFFATQQAVKQDLPDHLQNHIDKDSKQHP